MSLMLITSGSVNGEGQVRLMPLTTPFVTTMRTRDLHTKQPDDLEVHRSEEYSRISRHGVWVCGVYRHIQLWEVVKVLACTSRTLRQELERGVCV